MPSSDVYYLEINTRRCSGGTSWVLQPDTSGDLVRLQERVVGVKAQLWQVISVFEPDGQYSGVVFINQDTLKALEFTDTGQFLKTNVWHPDEHNPSYVWTIRPSGHPEYTQECSIAAAITDSGVGDTYVIDANGHDDCQGARALLWAWSDNNNQYWTISPAR